MAVTGRERQARYIAALKAEGMVRVAVVLAEDRLKRLEVAAKALGISRDTAINDAIEFWSRPLSPPQD